MRIFGFILRLVLVVALVIWLADRPGTAQIVWRDFQIDTSAAVLGVILLAVAYAAVLLHRIWRFMWDGPRFWKLRHRIGEMEAGQTEMAKGLAALAAGQAAAAGKSAVKARKLLGETPITRLIQAQAAHLAGDHNAAKSLFEAMTQDPATAMLGYRGLIASALRRGAYEEAAAIVRRIEPSANVPWLNLVQFEIDTRGQDWRSAGEALAKARKSRALPPPQANRNEAALCLARAGEALRDRMPKEALEQAERARKLAPDWLPAFLLLAQAQSATGHDRAARRTLERAWALGPHPQIAALALAQADKPVEAYRRLEKWSHGAAQPESQLALAEAAFRADLWGEARRHLEALVRGGGARRAAYLALAKLERREKGDERAASAALAKALTAPPDPAWLCGACGAAHEAWHATCPACGAFNRLTWAIPGQASAAMPPRAAQLEWLGDWG